MCRRASRLGLAWTEAGGDVLYIESALLPNGKGLTLTGQLGEVMQESAKIAQSYIWAHAAEFGIDPETDQGKRRTHPRAGRSYSQRMGPQPA